MNRTYKLVWNAVQQAWVVASELGKSRKKSKAGSLLLAVAALGVVQVALAAPASRAIPVLDNIASGTATTTTGTAGDGRTLLTVDQTSDKLIANWTSFDVGQFSRVIFNQPTASSIALNRIAATAPSQIFGQVQANGQIILVNPAGIVFGSSGRVNAGSVIASTLDITDANFNAGVLQFDRGTSTGAIDNQGIIIAENGNTFVFAPTVTNSGTLRAQAGNVTIANGNRLTVDATAGTATLNQVSGIAGLIQSTGVIRGDRLSTTDKGKVFIVGDRVRTGSIVSLAGDIISIGNDVKGKAVNITGNLGVNANTNFNAVNSLNVDGVLTVNGNNRLLSLAYGVTGIDGLNYGDFGKINLPGNNIVIRDNNIYFNTIVRTLAELQAIGANTTSLAGRYIIAADIDASNTGTTSFLPIGTISNPFTGGINGLGHKVDNLTINLPNSDNVGLIGYTRNSVIEGIKLTNVNISGRQFVGALVGSSGMYSGGVAQSGSYISHNQVSGIITGSSWIGGLIGSSMDSPVLNNYSLANVSLTGGGSYVGGLIGKNIGSSVNNSHTSGTVHGDTGTNLQGQSTGGLIGENIDSSINSSYATGDVYGRGMTGGLIGSNFRGSVSDSYASGNVLTQGSYAGGLIGYTTSGDVTRSHASGQVKVRDGYAGGLLGYAGYGKVTLSYATGSVQKVDNPNTVNYLGGLIGLYAASSNIVLDSNYATGNVTGDSYLGGLIGQINLFSSNVNDAAVLIKNSYAQGDINTSDVNAIVGGVLGAVYYADSRGGLTLNNTYASGHVTIAASQRGGLVGAFNAQNMAGATSLTGNHWVSDDGFSAIGVGYIADSSNTRLTTTQSKQLSSYSGWSISNQLTGSNSIWYINEGVSTPVLRALMTP